MSRRCRAVVAAAASAGGQYRRARTSESAIRRGPTGSESHFFKIVPLLFFPQLDNHEIKPGKTLRIKISVPNLRLFVGNIPKSKGKEEILEEFGKLTGKVSLE